MNWTQILSQVSKIQIKSVTDSLFKNGIYMLVLGTVSAICHTAEWVTIVLFVGGGLFEITGLLYYGYFAKHNPDYLRSESFQISKQSIELLGDKNNKLNPNVREVIAIANPYAKEIVSGSKTLKQVDVQ